MRNRIYKFILCSIILSALVLVPMIAHASSSTSNSSVNLINVIKNESGAGYFWDNKYRTLTLTNLNIDTDDLYGLRLPDNATVILVGDNYIKASHAAIQCVGNTTFKGDGSLTLASDDMGLFINTTNNRKSVKIVSGNYNLNTGNSAICSEHIPLSIADCKINIQSNNKGIVGWNIAINNAAIKSDSPITATNDLLISDSDIDINAKSPALVSQKGRIELNKMDISSNGGLIDKYNNEFMISTSGNVEHYTKSVLFGSGVKIWVDYVLVIGIIVLVSAIIFIKIYSQKIKDKKKREEIEAIRNSNMVNSTKTKNRKE